MSLAGSIVIGSISGLFGIISMILGIIIIKKTVKNMIFDVADELINEQIDIRKADVEKWINSETGQKAFYSVGALIGNGAKAGIGLNTRGGKFKIEDIIAQIAGSFIENRFPMKNNGDVSAPTSPQSLSKA